MHFKRLGSRHNYKEIEISSCVFGFNVIICKTCLKHIQTLTHKCNIITEEHFEAIWSHTMYLCGIHNFAKCVHRKGVTSFYAMIPNWLRPVFHVRDFFGAESHDHQRAIYCHFDEHLYHAKVYHVIQVRPVFHECAETRTETQKMMCLLRIYFCSRKRVHENDPCQLFRFDFSARWNVRVSACMETGFMRVSTPVNFHLSETSTRAHMVGNNEYNYTNTFPTRKDEWFRSNKRHSY